MSQLPMSAPNSIHMPQMRTMNPYREGDECFSEEKMAQVIPAPNKAILKPLTDSHFALDDGSAIILTGNSALRKTGVLVNRLIVAGPLFEEAWNCKAGDLFLLHAFGTDTFGPYALANIDDIELKYPDGFFLTEKEEIVPQHIEVSRDLTALSDIKIPSFVQV